MDTAAVLQADDNPPHRRKTRILQVILTVEIVMQDEL
jgi:hypothetical protein